MKQNDWNILVKGDKETAFEISVVHNSDTHGIDSYEWGSLTKIIIKGHYSDRCRGVSDEGWDKAIEIANKVAYGLNNEVTDDTHMDDFCSGCGRLLDGGICGCNEDW